MQAADAKNLIDLARLLACSAPHSGDWLHALLISNCGLRLDDETIVVVCYFSGGISIPPDPIVSVVCC